MTNTYTPKQHQREQDDATMEQMAVGFGLSMPQFLALRKDEFEAHWARYTARYEADMALRQRRIALAEAMRAFLERYPPGTLTGQAWEAAGLGLEELEFDWQHATDADIDRIHACLARAKPPVSN
jgi:hypothetical protein